MLMNRFCVLCGSMEDWNLSEAAPVELLLFSSLSQRIHKAPDASCVLNNYLYLDIRNIREKSEHFLERLFRPHFVASNRLHSLLLFPLPVLEYLCPPPLSNQQPATSNQQSAISNQQTASKDATVSAIVRGDRHIV